jgi:hypothetical protein
MRGDGTKLAKQLLPQVAMLSFLSPCEIQALSEHGEYGVGSLYDMPEKEGVSNRLPTGFKPMMSRLSLQQLCAPLWQLDSFDGC